MRISDWSSDVCSSDLEAELARSRAAAARGASGEANPQQVAEGLVAVIERTEHGEAVIFTVDIDPALRLPIEDSDLAAMLGALVENAARPARRQARSEERRRGKGCARTGISRWSPAHKTKQYLKCKQSTSINK